MGTTMLITQDTLAALQRLEERIDRVKRELKKLASDHEVLDAPLMVALLEKTARIEPGRLTVSLDWSHRRSPDYKAWIDTEHGEGTAKKILEATKPTETPFLVIEEAAHV